MDKIDKQFLENMAAMRKLERDMYEAGIQPPPKSKLFAIAEQALFGNVQIFPPLTSSPKP